MSIELEDIKYILYDVPKDGLFRVETGEYDLNGGWIRKEELMRIIGEDDTGFITEIRYSQLGIWDENGRRTIQCTIPVGVHKSRLVRWMPTQLSLF